MCGISTYIQRRVPDSLICQVVPDNWCQVFGGYYLRNILALQSINRSERSTSTSVYSESRLYTDYSDRILVGLGYFILDLDLVTVKSFYFIMYVRLLLYSYQTRLDPPCVLRKYEYDDHHIEIQTFFLSRLETFQIQISYILFFSSCTFSCSLELLYSRIRLDPRHYVNGFVHVMHYVNSIFHVMVSDGLAAAVQQVNLHGHYVNGLCIT